MNKNIFLNVEGYDLPLHFAFPEDIEEEEFNSIVSEIVANFIEDLKDKGVIDINRESLLIVDNVCSIITFRKTSKCLRCLERIT